MLKSGLHKKRRTFGLALEPRMMFDAAAMATAVSLPQPDSNESNNDNPAEQSEQSEQSDIVTFAVDADVGPQVELQPDPASLEMLQTIDRSDFQYIYEVESSGDFVYALGQSRDTGEIVGTLVVLKRDSSSGELSHVQTLDVQYNSDNELVVSGDGAYLYMSGYKNGSVGVFSINPDNGSLNLVQEVTVGNGYAVKGLVLSDDNKFAYILSNGNNNNGVVTIYSVNEDDGSLGAGTEVVHRNLKDGLSVTVSDDGGVLYVVSSSKITVLARETDSTWAYSTSVNITGADVVEHDGWIYAIDQGKDSIKTYRYLADSRELQFMSEFTPDSSEFENPVKIVMSEDGNTMYVSSYVDSWDPDEGKSVLSVIKRNHIDGTLTYAGSYKYVNEDSSDPLRYQISSGLALSSDGKSIYTTLTAQSGEFDRINRVIVYKLIPPVVTYAENTGFPVLLAPTLSLSSPALDAKDNYNGAKVTITRNGGARAEDIFAVNEKGDFSLLGQNVVYKNTTIATFSSVDGTLTITFVNDVAKSVAQDLLRQVTYANSSKDPVSSLQMAIVLSDGIVESSAALADVTIIQKNDAPIVSATPVNPVFKEGGGSVSVFQDATIDTVENGQSVVELQFTVQSVSPDVVEFLRVDGTEIALTDKAYGLTKNGLNYVVVVENGTATVRITTLSGSPLDTQSASSLVNGVGYASNGSGLFGTRTVSLVFVKDDGGVDNDGNDSVFISDITSTVTLSGGNEAPIVHYPVAGESIVYHENGAPVAIAPAVEISDAEYDALNSGSGNYSGAVLKVWFLEHQAGNMLSFTDSDAIKLVQRGDSWFIEKNLDLIASVDRSNGEFIVRFHEGEFGEIPTTQDVQTVLQSIHFENTSVTAFTSVASIGITLSDRAVSSDLSTVDIEIRPGNLAPQLVPGSALGLGESIELDGTIFETSSDGEHVYVVQGKSIVFLGRNSEELQQLQVFESDQIDWDIRSISIAPDDRYLHVYSDDNSHQGVFAIYALGEDGSIGDLVQIVPPHDAMYGVLRGVTSTVYSADGKFVFVSTTTESEYDHNVKGELYVFSRDLNTGELSEIYYEPTLADDYTTIIHSGAGELMLSADGKYLYVINRGQDGFDMNQWRPLPGVVEHSAIRIYSVGDDGNITFMSRLTQNEGLVDIEVLRQAVTSTDGSLMYVLGQDKNSKHAALAVFRRDADSGNLTFDSMKVYADIDLAKVRDMYVLNDELYLALDDDLRTIALGSDGMPDDVVSQKPEFGGVSGIHVNADGSWYVLGGGKLSTWIAKQTYSGEEDIILMENGSISDREFDAKGDYQGTSIIIHRSGGADFRDVFGFSVDENFSILDGVIYRDGTSVADFSQEGGRLTLTFTGSVSQQDVNAVIQRITYGHHAVAQGLISLDIIVSDGESQSSPAKIDIELNVISQAPDISLTPVNTHYVEKSAPVPLFGNVKLDLHGVDETVLQISLRLQGVIDLGHERLHIGDEVIIIGSGISGVSGKGYRWEITDVGGGIFELQILSDNGISASEAVALLENIKYDSTSENPTVTSPRAISLLAIRDSGGSSNGGSDLTTLEGVQASIQIEAVNDAPRPQADIPNNVNLIVGDEYEYILPDFVDPENDAFTIDVSGLPEGFTYDSDTRLISGHAITDSLGRHEVTIQVTDVNGASNSYILALQITENAPPAIMFSLEDLRLEAGHPLDYQLPGDLFVDPQGDAFTLEVSGLPAGLSFDPQTKKIIGNPSTDMVGQYTITITATDIRGASSQTVFDLNITLPTIASTLSSYSNPDSALLRDTSVPSVAVPIAPYADIWSPDSTKRHLTLDTVWHGFNGFGARAVGEAPLTMDSLSSNPGMRGLPFYLTETAGSEWERELASRQIIDVVNTPLFERSGAGETYSGEAIHASVQWDMLNGRYEYQLSAGLFSGRHTLVSVALVRSDGSPLPDGMRLDVRSGKILASTGSGGQWDLVLVAQTQDGGALQVPVILMVPDTAVDAVLTEQQPNAAKSLGGEDLQGAQAAVSDHIQRQASSGLALEAQRLINLLSDAPQRKEPVA